MDKAGKISNIQFFFMVFAAQLNLGIYAMPSPLFTAAKGSAWLAVIVAWGAASACAIIMYMLARQFPGQSIYEYSSILTGRTFGTFLTICYVIYFLTFGGWMLWSLCEVLKSWMFLWTPKWFLSLCIGITCYLLGEKSISAIARVCSIVTCFSVLIFLIFLLLSFKDYMRYGIEPLRFMPFIQSDVRDLAKAIQTAFIHMLGFQIIMIIFPFVKPSKSNAFKALMLSLLGTAIIFMLVICSITLCLSKLEVTLMEYPWLYILQGTALQTVNRLDQLFIPIWLSVVIVSISLQIYISSQGLKILFRLQSHRKPALWAAVLIALTVTLPISHDTLKTFNRYLAWTSYALVIGFPLLLLMLSKIKASSIAEAGR
ncbi:GerAB/ArcD/ProY family transporter [Paenibacillus montanisoli]|uniref:Uncharacterized protein n=1 Tax=Paenibacillus montanisoli TaxID=2081970 RepID=A0A328U6M1_9BACL|nr:GerAB/ArcD/ProY family transporter [Paenibacillus montanisoli]RAP75636.1 hypothetical protein DL346_09240 [Paenibacillus montanisoli]